MIFRHPSKRSLRAWLAGESSADVERHIGGCDVCAASLESLAETDDAAMDGGLSDLLASAFAVPDDLTDRLTVGVASRLDSRQVVGLMTDLFGAGLETSIILLTEHRRSEGP